MQHSTALRFVCWKVVVAYFSSSTAMILHIHRHSCAKHLCKWHSWTRSASRRSVQRAPSCVFSQDRSFLQHFLIRSQSWIPFSSTFSNHLAIKQSISAFYPRFWTAFQKVKGTLKNIKFGHKSYWFWTICLNDKQIVADGQMLNNVADGHIPNNVPRQNCDGQPGHVIWIFWQSLAQSLVSQNTTDTSSTFAS